jgi:predicted metal-dependent hydrolase
MNLTTTIRTSLERKKVGVRIEKIVIKHLKNRLGSMRKQGSINLNVNLLKASEDVIDYIILHELLNELYYSKDKK